jgi:3-hydroxyacyl-[acyl-carrier-protein] dehydratase
LYDPQSQHLAGSKVISHFEVREDLEILKGHFPGNPILPGVVQVEMMAQTSAFVSIAFNKMEKAGVRVDTLLLGVESSRFRKPIYPGMKLEIHAEMEKSRGTIAYYKCDIFCAGEKVSEAKFLAKLDVHKG